MDLEDVSQEGVPGPQPTVDNWCPAVFILITDKVQNLQYVELCEMEKATESVLDYF